MHEKIEEFCNELDQSQIAYNAQNFGEIYQNLKQIQFYKNLSVAIRNTDHKEIDGILLNDLEYCKNLIDQCNNFIQKLNTDPDKYFEIINTYNINIEKILSPHFGYFVGLDNNYDIKKINARSKKAEEILNKIQPFLENAENNIALFDDSKKAADEILNLKTEFDDKYNQCLELIKEYNELNLQIKVDKETASKAKDEAVAAADAIKSTIENAIEQHRLNFDNKTQEIADFIEKNDKNIN